MKKSWIMCILVLLLSQVFSMGQSRKNTIRMVNYASSQYLYLADVAGFYGMIYSATGKNILLQSKYSSLKFTVKSRTMVLNGVQVYLSRPIVFHKNTYIIGKSDFQLLLEPILRPAAIPKHKITTILLDPGHGGKDVGAVSDKFYEKDINLQVALRLAYKLRAKGFNVCMTRDKDTEIQLSQRTKYAATCGADLYISLHCNSASSTVTGLETFISTPAGDPPTGDNYIAKDQCPSNAFNSVNAYLAYHIQRNIIKQTNMDDRGLKRRRFYVIRNVPCPAILVEMGFISNNKELKLLKNSVHQEKIANAISEAVSRYEEIRKR